MQAGEQPSKTVEGALPQKSLGGSFFLQRLFRRRHSLPCPSPMMSEKLSSLSISGVTGWWGVTD